MATHNEARAQPPTSCRLAAGLRKGLAIALASLVIPLSACTIGQTRISFGAGLAADLATTQSGISGGATESNPTLSSSPLILAVAGSAVFVLLAEYLSHNGHSDTAKWLYGAGAVLHGGAAVWNSGQSGGGGTSTSASVTTASALTAPRVRPVGVNVVKGKALGVRAR